MPAQLEHHPVGAGDLAKMGAGATDAGETDEQRRRCIKEALGLEREFVVAQGDAAAQLVAVGVDAGADGRGEASKAFARIAVQHHLPVELLGAGALVEGMAAVAMQLVVAAMGLEGPAEELLAGGGVLGDQQDRADGGGPGEGAVDVGQAGAVAGGVVVGAVAAVACGVWKVLALALPKIALLLDWVSPCAVVLSVRPLHQRDSLHRCCSPCRSGWGLAELCKPGGAAARQMWWIAGSCCLGPCSG